MAAWWGAVLTGFLGVALILKPTIAPDQWKGALCGLVSGMLSATAYLQVTALGRAGEPEVRVVFYFSLCTTLAGGLAALLGGFHAHHSVEGVGLLLATGLLATLAQILMTRAYAIGRTLSNASLQYLGIAWSFIFGVTLFHDPVTLSALVGMLLIVAAGLAATLLRQRALPDGAEPSDS